jgi:hypothetical protein
VTRRLDLMPDGALARLDRAIALVRGEGPEPALVAISAGALPALVVVSMYWLERVEGVFDLRPLLAAALVGSFGLRSIVLAGVTRRYVRTFWPAAEIPPRAGAPIAVLRTAFMVSLGLSMWGAVILALSVLGPFGVAAVAPVLSVRGLLAPGWLARVACTEDAGSRAVLGAFGDNGHQRGEGFVAELLLSLGALGLTINLLVALGFVLLLSRAFLGLDLALLDQFLSFRNTFAMLCAALVSLALLEPLRAALSAIVFVDARVRSEGLDVRSAIDAAIEHGQRGRRGAAAKAAVLLLALAFASRAEAQDTPEPAADVPPELVPLATDAAVDPDDLARDAEVLERTRRILLRPAYEEFADQRGRGLRELFARWLDELLSDTPEETPEAPAGFGALPLPGPGVFIVLGVLFALAIAVYLVLRREPDLPAAQAEAPAAAKLEDPRERAPKDWLDSASELARAGKHREALRALYLATLVALDRKQALTFDPTLTNWQYLRQLRDGALRTDFRELTRIFDHKWYGHEPADQLDFDLCRELAERMIRRVERSVEVAA